MSIAQNPQPSTSPGTDEVDIGKLFGILIDNRWMIIITTFIFAVVGIGYALLATPIYKADALIQIEAKSSGPSLGGDMAEMFGGGESSATTETEIIKSRMILGETVDKLNLTTIVSPEYLPVVGKGLARLMGEQHFINISRFTVADGRELGGYQIVVTNADKGEYQLNDSDGRKVLTGKVGELAQANGYQLFVTDLQATKDAEFSLAKISRIDAIQNLQQNLSVAEQGKQTGILQLSMTGENRADIKAIVDDISKNYFLQNVERNSA
ncbi:MAG: tyrosine-protein kinase, partial [Photobacterium aquimaris]|nr:tyrosine-protein kinase [Photobacterium aquimaris]